MAIASFIRHKIAAFTLLLLMLCWVNFSFAQDLEPRRWSQIPSGVNFLGFGYGYTNGDIFFDPLLLVEEATFETHKVGLVYMRSMGVLNMMNSPAMAGMMMVTGLLYVGYLLYVRRYFVGTEDVYSQSGVSSAR